MQEKIFKPKYLSSFYLRFVFVILLEAFALWSIFFNSEKSILMIFMAGFFGFMILLMPSVLIRQISFESNSFTIEKFAQPPQTINFSDVIDIGVTVIKTKQGNIVIRIMENAEELTSFLKKFISESKTDSYQIENKLVEQKELRREAIQPSAIISGVLWIAYLFFFPSDKSLFRDFSIFLFLIPTYILVYRYMKNKAANQQNAG